MLINCVAYRNGRKLADLPVAGISDYLARDDTFVWVAMRDASPAELAQMQAEFGLHELAVEDAQRGHQRPKIEEYGDSLFVVVKTVEQQGDELVLGEIDIFVGRNYVLSSRQNSTHDMMGVRARAEREPHLLRHGAGFVLYALMDAAVDRYFPLVNALESELEQIEERIFAGTSQRDNIEQLYDLKRKVMILRHAVAPLLDAIGKLHGGRVPEVCANSQEYFRDVHDHLASINGILDSIRDTIATAIQVNLSMIALEEGEVNKRLAAWAAIFGVLTAFAGIWGMNFEFMPELKSKYGYPLALAAMFSVCFYLYRRFRKARWL
ncbi:magnesium/cobalt transporter CorA [Pseudoduganella umbonata]|uniref:Magnesium transport protein CorA n=1 Tax=Pseudoduganella umbonata TaxID=864828 RepID=A0A4P8HVZ4_9BURK|nr:magnesium/cobalt transporter CorA [Pseudoduganella umbonata]MBB3223562.1 magnesium transporter [Pseudoduganella umbonata]QCP13566.1 magnesium/cobalt transporter CorA [Pseudoduganella umbonata]